MWKVVWLEKTWVSGVRKDALELEFVSLAKLSLYIFIKLKEVSEELKMWLPNTKLDIEELEKSLRIIQRVGMSESLASPIPASAKVYTREELKLKGQEGWINTYCPLNWLKYTPLQGLKADLLVHLNLLRTPVIHPSEIVKHRLEKEAFILPLSRKELLQRGRRYEYFEPITLNVSTKPELTILSLPDGCHTVLPSSFIRGD